MGARGFLFLSVLLLFILLPREAQLSGSFEETYGEEEFIVQFDNRRHKVYRSAEQARRLFDGFRHDFFRTMNRKGPGLRALLRTARARKIPIVPVNLGWPEALLEEPFQVQKIQASSYPLILALRIEPESGGRYHVKLAMASPPPVQQLVWLADELTRLLEADAAMTTAVDLTAFGRPRVIRQGKLYSLYAACLFFARDEARVAYERQLAALADKAVAALERRLASPDFEKETGTRLRPIAPAMAKSRRKGDALYNPRGPAVDEEAGVEFVRPVFDNGYLVVRVLTAPEKYDWGALSMKLEAWLGQAMGVRKVERVEGK